MSLLTHYSCYCGPLQSRALTQCSCCWARVQQSVCHRCFAQQRK